MMRRFPVRSLVLLALSALLIAGCGGGGSSDGSKEDALLKDGSFTRAVKDVGVAPSTRPAAALGKAVGTSLRAILVDTGRLAPESFSEPYRSQVRALGKLSQASFRRRHGDGPLEFCDRAGLLVGLLVGAPARGELAKGVLEGFGSDGLGSGALIDSGGDGSSDQTPVELVRGTLSGRLPDDEQLPCASHFRGSYVFARRLTSSG